MRPETARALAALRELVQRLDTDSRALPQYPQVAELQAMRQQWSQLRSEQQVRRSLQAQPPADGGPLNSAVLVQRMLELMHDASPGYLRHFIDYVDTLSWLQQVQDTPPPSADGARAKRSRKPRTA